MHSTFTVDGQYRVTFDASRVLHRLSVRPGWDEALAGSPARMTAGGGFVPAVALAHKAKVVNDGLLAAVELLVQRRRPGVPGKAVLLQSLATALLQSPETPSAWSMAERVATA